MDLFGGGILDTIRDFNEIADLLEGGKAVQRDSNAIKVDTSLLKPQTSVNNKPEVSVKTETPSSSDLVYKDFLGGEHETKEAARAASAKQYVGISAASSGLQLAGSIMDIRQQEQDALRQIQDQFEFQAHEIEANASIRGMAKRKARSKNILARANALNRQAVGGGRQRQQFFIDPETGAPL